MISRSSLGDAYPIRKLGELIEFLDSIRRPVTESDRKAGPYPYYGANGQQGWIDSFLFDEPLVLLAEDGGHFENPDRGIAYRVFGKTWVNNHAHVLRPTPGLDLNYLCRVLENYDVTPFVTGTTRGKLTKGGASEIPIPLPPLPEQRRIAAILDQADALRAKRWEALAELDQLTQSIFIEMFGDPERNPKGWNVRDLAEICEVKGGKRLPKGEEYSLSPTPYRYIRVTDLRDGTVNENDLVYLTPEVQARISRYTVSEGDVIISIAGSIGLIAPVTKPLDGVNLTENAAKLVPRDRTAVDAQYLASLLQTDFIQRQIASHVGQVTIGKFALFRIEKLRLPFAPIALQKEFSLRLHALIGLREKLIASVVSLDSLFSSLQHRAFRGEL